MRKILLVKPADRFLENEFVFPQLAPHYLQSYLKLHGIESDLLVLHEPDDVRKGRKEGKVTDIRLEQLIGILVTEKGTEDFSFSERVFSDYDVVAVSTMSPQAPEAYMISKLINSKFPRTKTAIGGQHARYYFDSVRQLPQEMAFDFIVPNDGWEAILAIARNEVPTTEKNNVISLQLNTLENIPPPTRPIDLIKRYQFQIAGVPAFHAITSLGCPFSCNFCESSREKIRKFPIETIREDLRNIANAHRKLGREKYAIMFFDDVGLMNPSQVEGLSAIVKENGFSTWRAFTHADLVYKFGEQLLKPFYETGGRRIGMGLETGSQKSMDLIGKRNGQKQSVEENYEAVRIANKLGVAVDAFTMIFPWETEKELKETTKLVEFVAHNTVNGTDELGRPLLNHIDSTIMSPFQGTPFYDMIKQGRLEGVSLADHTDPGLLFYKGPHGGSGWNYDKTALPRERYESEQAHRNALRPKYR